MKIPKKHRGSRVWDPCFKRINNNL